MTRELGDVDGKAQSQTFEEAPLPCTHSTSICNKRLCPETSMRACVVEHEDL